MSSHISSRPVVEVLVSAVSGGVVGGVVLPAAPDDVGSTAGEDAFVEVGFAAGAQFAVAGGGPVVAPPAVAGKVADRFSEFGVAGPSERGALGRSAPWPVDAPWTAGPRKTHDGGRTAIGDGPVGTRECIAGFTATDARMVHE